MIKLHAAPFEKAKATAVELAIKKYPTKRGMFDGQRRLFAYYESIMNQGWAVRLGAVTEDEVEEQLSKIGLDR